MFHGSKRIHGVLPKLKLLLSLLSLVIMLGGKYAGTGSASTTSAITGIVPTPFRIAAAKSVPWRHSRTHIVVLAGELSCDLDVQVVRELPFDISTFSPNLFSKPIDH